MTAREENLIAREMLLHPELLGQRLKERRWADVAALVRYVQQDVPPDLALTDPALYQALRDGVTRFYLRGGGKLRLERLESLARQSNTD
jgi:hypothetical protein